MMQKAVLAARATALDVDDDAPIPTLHWPPIDSPSTPPTTTTTTGSSGTNSTVTTAAVSTAPAPSAPGM